MKNNYMQNAAMIAIAMTTSAAYSPVAAQIATTAAATLAADRLTDDIVVTATKLDALEIGGSVHVLDAVDMSRFAYSDVNHLLRQIPGVNIQEEDGFGLRPNIGIRGSGSDRSARVAVMEDGILIAPAPYAAPAAYYFPHVARMSGVEVSKGPATIKYGPMTVGGAINLSSTPIPKDTSGFAELLAGSFDGRRAHGWAGGWTGLGSDWEIGALAEGLYEHSDGFKRIDIGGNTGFEVEDWVLKLGLRSTDGRHAFEFKYQDYSETSNETYLGLTLADFQASPYRRYNASQADRMHVEHQTYQLTHRFEVSPAFTVTTIGYRNDTARAWYKLNDIRNTANTGWVSIGSVLANPTANANQMAEIIGASGFTGLASGALRVRNNNRVYQSTGIQSLVSAKFATGGIKHDLELSARYHEDEEDRFQQDDRYQMVNGRMVLVTAGAPGSQDNRLGAAQAWSFFIRDTIEAGAFTVVPGLRYETIDLKQTRWATSDPTRAGATTIATSKVDVWIPGIAVTWKLMPDIRIIAGAHRGFASPGPGSTADAETSWNYEAGLKMGDGAWYVEAIGFYNDYANLVGTCSASTGGDCNIGDQFNGGNVRVKGIELTAGRTLGRIADNGFEVPVSLSYTLSDAKFQTSFVSGYEAWGTVTAGDRLPYLPRHQLSLNSGISFTGARLSAALNWVSETRAKAGRGAIAAGEKIDDHVTVDVAAEVDVFGPISVFGTIQNLFDAEYNVAFAPAGARPGAPRIVQAGLRARF